MASLNSMNSVSTNCTKRNLHFVTYQTYRMENVTAMMSGRMTALRNKLKPNFKGRITVPLNYVQLHWNCNLGPLFAWHFRPFPNTIKLPYYTYLMTIMYTIYKTYRFNYRTKFHPLCTFFELQAQHWHSWDGLHLVCFPLLSVSSITFLITWIQRHRKIGPASVSWLLVMWESFCQNRLDSWSWLWF